MIKKFEEFSGNEIQNYIFINNLKQMKKQVDEMLSMDEKKLDEILKEHNWALDHIATSKDDIEEVYNFLMNYNESKKACWKGYKQVGFKTKDGKKVPNCVPDSEDEISEQNPVEESYDEELNESEIPERYKNLGFTEVGKKKKSTRPGKKWMVLAKKGDQYKVVHGGDSNMEDFKQHKDKDRQSRFWDRMGGKNSANAKDPFSPLYWHKKFGTW